MARSTDSGPAAAVSGPVGAVPIDTGAGVARRIATCIALLALGVPAAARTPGPPDRFAPCPDAVPAGMACVPGGPFVRGSDAGPADARPASTVVVGTFLMDVDEVTFGEYAACVRAGRCTPARPKYVDFDDPRQPMTGVDWFQAQAYCRAHGKRLPTEAEWEKAARGPEGAAYPWGDAPATCERAVIMDASGRGCGRTKRGSHPEKGKPWPVGSRPAGAYGLRDMAGNSYEWVADWYAKDWAACGAPCAGPDPRGPCDGAARCPGHRLKVVRGGSWYWPAEHAAGWHRRAHVPANQPFHHFGFRCAADVSVASKTRGSGAQWCAFR